MYVGAGPRLSLDQKITFVNENNCLARRIIQVGNRSQFMSGFLDRNGRSRGGSRMSKNSSRQTLSYSSNSRRLSARNDGKGIHLPGLDHKVGTTNSAQRRREFEQISRYNLKMAKKLIDTKSVISYDEQLRHSMNHVKFKNMIQKGGVRAEKYSMLDMRDGRHHRSVSRRSHEGLSERSYNSARARGAQESPSSLRSRKQNKFYKMQKQPLVSSALHSQNQHMKKFARPVDGAGSVVLDLSQDTPTQPEDDMPAQK